MDVDIGGQPRTLPDRFDLDSREPIVIAREYDRAHKGDLRSGKLSRQGWRWPGEAARGTGCCRYTKGKAAQSGGDQKSPEMHHLSERPDALERNARTFDLAASGGY